MGFLDRLFGTEPVRRPTGPGAVPPAYAVAPAGPGPASPPAAAPSSSDEQAIARYRYLLRTAPPETIEQVHAEAFAALSPAQRQQVLGELSAQLPVFERPQSADPRALARAATRAEFARPGFMERTFAARPGFASRPGPAPGFGTGFGTMFGAGILGSVVGYVTTAAIMSAFITPEFGIGDAGGVDAGATDAGAAGFDGGAGGFDGGAFDGDGFDGGAFGGDFGGFGGGDFGGFDI